MTRRGFTVVELIITITIMGILLTLAVVSLNATQVGARDEERKADVQAIALSLETFYKNGTEGSSNFNRYPTTNLVSSGTVMQSTLRDANPKIFMAPGIDDPTQTFIAATNADETTTGVLPQPITIDQYIYQPLLPNDTLCTGTAGTEDCRRFNIFYRLEGDNTVYKLTSKNQ